MNILRNNREGEQGQGMGYLLVISAVLLVLLVALVDLVVREMKAGVMVSKKNVLLHAADAGVDRGILALQVANNWKDIPAGNVGGYNADMIFTEVPGVIYRLKIQEGNWTPGYEIGDAVSERTITVYAAQLSTGDRKKIQAVVMQSTIGSALFSGGQVSLGGNTAIHWGPVVSYSTASDSIPNPQTIPVFISAGGILGAYNKCSDPYAVINGGCVKEYATDLGAAPVFPLDDMRSIAKGQGTYQGGGLVCYDPDTSILGNKDDDTVVFWDSADGKNYNPTTDATCSKGAPTTTTHGVDVKISGNWGGKGTLVIMGDLDISGTNNQPTVMFPPNDCYPKYGDLAGDCNNGNSISTNVMWDGLVYIAGNLKGTGNKKIYGSVYAYSAAQSKGTVDIYYKTNNKGNQFLGKTVVTKLWMERAPTTSEYISGFFSEIL